MSAQEDRRRTKVLSCSSCRNRKIKCDKAQPICTQCTSFGFECAYPSRKPTRRAPRLRQTELLDRISRLETIVGKADPEKLRQLDQEFKASRGGDIAAPAEGVQNPETQAAPVHGVEKRYLSGEFWGHLCTEIEGIRQVLDQPSDDDDDDDEGDSPESVEAASSSTLAGASGFSLGNPSHHESGPLQHPPPEMMSRLWAIYTRNVDPLMKVLHCPTIARLLQAYTESPSPRPFDPPTNAVIFAIYFCAVTCLRPEDCLEKLGESRDVLSTRYRINVEQALAEADYLNSNELETLQALALYTAILRCYSHDRSSWVVTALLIRIAQGQGIHRDGEGRRFTPYVAEMRRRLWYFIIVIDVRGSEDRGSDAIMSRVDYSTRMPTHIDDDDFGPNSTGPLIPKSTPADNVILMCTATCSSIFGLMTHPHTNALGETPNFVYTEDDLITHIRHLEESFIHTAVTTHLPSVYASEIARVVILKMWLNIQYPFTTAMAPIRRVSRETMLRTSLSLMDLRQRMTSGAWGDRYAWWTDTYVQWHPLAVTLAELCVQTEGELVDRAWEVVDRNFPASRDHIADSAGGSLWRPIKKLLKKAKSARAEALMKKLSITEAPPVIFPAESIEPIPVSLPDDNQTTGFQASTDVLAQLYDTTTMMDPSFLFEYPPDPLMMDLGTDMGQTGPLEWSMWTEFLNDTQLDESPGGSGTAYST
ncbi:hypothetical protein G7Z17_g10431 [Cylindrodendrum hubeiense]|uniref:Zn(2)-C6 fungal-type domain-containing protein n=1 Tax=Cylindrodendrum hubeiense TaxID=595255 RepID=A0A9P5H4W1_9HYPO|nr:hypothetical protein G7Z17_g10431 [Cylindrodendrum hubeiense]